MIIGEFGSTFCDSVGIETSISSVPHELVANVVSKADIYVKLGIDCSQLVDMPEITILRNLELNFDFSNAVDDITKHLNYMRLSNLFLDLVIVNSEKMIRSDHHYLINNCSDIASNSIESCISKTVYSDYTYYGFKINALKLDNDIHKNISIKHDDEQAKIDFYNIVQSCLSVRVKKYIKLLIDDFKDKRQLSIDNERLEPQLTKLQSKIIEFFELPVQSCDHEAEISNFCAEITSLKSQIANFCTEITNLKNENIVIKSINSSLCKELLELRKLKSEYKEMVELKEKLVKMLE